MNKSVTLRDVAKVAKVSLATASRVLSESDYRVSAEARQRVLAAAGSLDYHVDQHARRMALRKTKLIGVILEDLRNPFYAEALELWMMDAELSGYSILPTLSGPGGINMAKSVQLLRQARVEGLIVGSSSLKEPALAGLMNQGIPIVFFNRHPDPFNGVFVGSDYETAQRISTDHVINLGHSRIALVTGPENSSTVQQRIRGFFSAIDHAKLDRQSISVIYTNFRAGDGRFALSHLLEGRPSPTAILTNDFLAIEMMGELTRRGLHVPRDITLVGMDDVDFAGHPRIRLTTVATHFHRQVEIAMERLMDLLDDGDDDPTIVRLPVELIVRDTSGPAPS